MTRANGETLIMTDAPAYETSMSQYVLITDFDEELNKEKREIDNWFAQVSEIERSNFRIEKNSIFYFLYERLDNVCAEYKREQKEKTALQLPEISEESFLAMLFLFPFLQNKSPSFYVDADLCSVAVTFKVKKNQKVSIATKTPRLFYLSKIGTEDEIRLPFSLASTLKLPTREYLKQLEKILSYL